jgi:peptidoglycan/LPS O-acetylase OafA/YrhL
MNNCNNSYLNIILNKENNNLDLVRILLAIFVIVGHSYALNGPGDSWIDPIRHFYPNTNSGPVAVKCFLFISGLVITNSILSNRNIIYFIVSRLFRIVPSLFFLLLVTVFIFGPLLSTDPLYWHHLEGFKYISNNLFFYTYHYLPGVFEKNIYPKVVNGSLWSLRFEVGCYFFLLLNLIILRKNSKYFLLLPILIVIFDTMSPTRHVFSFIDDNSDKYLLPFFFSFGALYAIYSKKININKITPVFFLLFLFITDSFLSEVLLSLSLCNLFLFFSKNKFFLKLKPRYDISYGIYLWGFLIQQSIYDYFGHLNIALHCFLSLLITMPLALLTHLVIEKPFILIGKKVFIYLNNFFSRF